MTNGEKIRSMSDKELAEEFCASVCEKHRVSKDCTKFHGKCFPCILRWIKEDVDE